MDPCQFGHPAEMRKVACTDGDGVRRTASLLNDPVREARPARDSEGLGRGGRPNGHDAAKPLSNPSDRASPRFSDAIRLVPPSGRVTSVFRVGVAQDGPRRFERRAAAHP